MRSCNGVVISVCLIRLNRLNFAKGTCCPNLVNTPLGEIKVRNLAKMALSTPVKWLQSRQQSRFDEHKPY